LQTVALLPLISKARLVQGKLLAKINGIGFELSREASADVLTEERIAKLHSKQNLAIFTVRLFRNFSKTLF
jgi:hypothetical protein